MAEKQAYIFKCLFNDGTTFLQTDDDVSPTTPGKNCFADVLARINDVATFTLISDTHTFAVDLHDGHFECDGVTFRIHSSQEIPHGSKLRLIYFRRHTHTTSAEGQTHDVAFHLGWQTTINGKNFQQTIAVD